MRLNKDAFKDASKDASKAYIESSGSSRKSIFKVSLFDLYHSKNPLKYRFERSGQ